MLLHGKLKISFFFALKLTDMHVKQTVLRLVLVQLCLSESSLCKHTGNFSLVNEVYIVVYRSVRLWHEPSLQEIEVCPRLLH